MTSRQPFFIHRWTRSYTTFSAQEFQEIVTPTNLPQTSAFGIGGLTGFWRKYRRFSSLEIAQCLVRNELERLGVGWVDAKAIGARAAHSVIYHAMLSCETACMVTGFPGHIQEFMEMYELDLAGLAYANGLRCEERFILWQPGQRPIMIFDIADAVDRDGTCVYSCIDLDKIALELCERAGRALVHIEVSGQSGFVPSEQGRGIRFGQLRLIPGGRAAS